MLAHRTIFISAFFFYWLFGNWAAFSLVFAQQKFKDQIVILKIAEKGFESKTPSWGDTIYAQFGKEAQKRFLSKKATDAKFRKLGILRETLLDANAYAHARDTMKVKHAIVIDLENLGTFVHVNFRLFTVKAKEPFEYPIGTTPDSLAPHLQMGVSKILSFIPDKEEGNAGPWIVLLIGGTAVVIAAILDYDPSDSKSDGISEIPIEPNIR